MTTVIDTNRKEHLMTTHDNHNDLDTIASGGCCGGTSKAEDLSVTASGGCCGGTTKADDLTDTRNDDVTECPVMVGIQVIKSEAEKAGFYRDYQGQRYWMCCDSCGRCFDTDPELYVTV